MGLNPAIVNLVISLGAMQLGRKIPYENPDLIGGYSTVDVLRFAYVFAQVLTLLVYYYCTIKIKSKNDTTTLKYLEPKQTGSQDPPQLINTTNRDYDLAEVTKAVRQVLIGIAMTGVMHFYFQFTQPLFLQSLMPFKNIWDAKIVQLHILNKPAVDDLKRPFKTGGIFGSMTDPQTDVTAIKDAETKPTLSRKDD